ncbi:hypothetical protein N7517_004773 [Penicillium concentricum]|uniref:Uncharacterized protein n=1 Tax=Penicillium concentricum TaxID=293559 RepID=A0A9W9S6Y7_9EURO|nr:uncharacterized protein N7517_004773 [Penicillium concentricum]KAJ5372767.1 hypothetical protein N7517_004773 [Penicillium concentricum]
MSERMCSAKHPLSRTRKTQTFLSVISWPCALAAVPITGGSPQTWIQLLAISISTVTPAFMLLKYRKSKNQCYSSFEIATDLLMALLMVGVYISGTVILSSQEISAWFTPQNYKLSRGIPQIYSNLSCVLLALLYFRSFAKGVYHKLIEPRMLKARRVNYTICPACDRSIDATMTQSQDTNVTAGQGRPTVSNVTPLDLYTDEPQLLLPESSLSVLGMQTTGVITTN